MKTLQQCVDHLNEHGQLEFCKEQGMGFPHNKDIKGFVHDGGILNNKIVPVYHDSQFEQSTAVIYLAQKMTMSEAYANELSRYPAIVIYVHDIGHAMHLLGIFLN